MYLWLFKAKEKFARGFKTSMGEEIPFLVMEKAGMTVHLQRVFQYPSCLQILLTQVEIGLYPG